MDANGTNGFMRQESNELFIQGIYMSLARAAIPRGEERIHICACNVNKSRTRENNTPLVGLSTPGAASSQSPRPRRNAPNKSTPSRADYFLPDTNIQSTFNTSPSRKYKLSSNPVRPVPNRNPHAEGIFFLFLFFCVLLFYMATVNACDSSIALRIWSGGEAVSKMGFQCKRILQQTHLSYRLKPQTR